MDVRVGDECPREVFGSFAFFGLARFATSDCIAAVFLHVNGIGEAFGFNSKPRSYISFTVIA